MSSKKASPGEALSTEKQLRNFAPAFRRHVPARAGSDGRTQAQYLEECDINVVVAKYRRADEPWPVNRNGAEPMYADLPDSTDLHSALTMVQDATNAFESLPAEVRERYLNDPVNFLSALQTPSERDFLLDTGVLEPHQMPELGSTRFKKMVAPTGPETPPETGA